MIIQFQYPKIFVFVPLRIGFTKNTAKAATTCAAKATNISGHLIEIYEPISHYQTLSSLITLENVW